MSQRRARKIAIVSIIVNSAMFVVATVLWAVAWMVGWVNSTAFVSHVSMATWVYAAIVGITAGIDQWFTVTGE